LKAEGFGLLDGFAFAGESEDSSMMSMVWMSSARLSATTMSPKVDKTVLRVAAETTGMRIVHDPDGEGGGQTLATTVDTADSFVAQTVGLMGRSSLPEDYALVFRFDKAARRFIHTLFVRTPLDVVWLVGDEVVKVKRLRPWTGVGLAKSDCIVELPAGAAEGVEVGDTVALETEPGGDAEADRPGDSPQRS